MVDEICRRNGQFTGFPVMGMKWQRMESHALRSAYKMKKEQKGILVRHVQPTYETAKHLKPDDIIMRFDGIQVASDGTVPFRSALTALPLPVTLRLPIPIPLPLCQLAPAACWPGHHSCCAMPLVRHSPTWEYAFLGPVPDVASFSLVAVAVTAGSDVLSDCTQL